ncbi:MAG TPA: MarR family transcriptional regulator [Candidatus Baltobacteraceae bacterium]|nr:MarR family transcriptional regulator [Candidatus Baltobacteraceae bacterium]
MNSYASRTPLTDVDDVALVADRVMEAVPAVMRRIRRAMRAEVAGQPGTTVPQLRALLFVRRHPGCSLSAMAEHLGMTPPACSGLAERLVRAGVLERTIDPQERRRVQLRLTSDGKERVAHADLRARSWLIEGLADLAPADLRALAGALELLERVTAEGDQP